MRDYTAATREKSHTRLAAGRNLASEIILFVSIHGRRIYKEALRGGKCLRIESAIIGMDSARSYSSKSVQTSAVSFSLMEAQNKVMTTDNETENEKKVSNDLSENLKDIQNRYQEMLTKTNRLSENRLRETFLSLKHQCMQYIFRNLFGRSMGNTTTDGYITSGELSHTTNYELAKLRPLKISEVTVETTESVYLEESEQTSFDTTGIVKTADGREISFNLSVEMSRSFAAYYENKYQETAVTFCDPLVINLDGNIAELSDQKFYFDLDADGTEEYISKLENGSGYLALDKNNDGTINDGNELFGTKSGDGFSDLTIYDEDGNGWIDENDDIWNQLKIWTTDENGKDVLYTLKEAGVGALCLQRAATDFTLTDDNNNTNGAIRSTGIFLYENGGVGTMQHLDLAQ